MNAITRFIPKEELGKYQEYFKSTTFKKVMDELNFDLLGKPNKTDIVRIEYEQENPEDYRVTETNKLMCFGDKAQVILKYYEATLGDKKDTGEVLHIWLEDDNGVVFKEYVGGELTVEEDEDEIYDVYKEYLGVPKLTEKAVADNEVMPLLYNPLSCIQSGSCCYFEKQRYEHCGASCGVHYASGGGTPINRLDICCRTHDREIHGKTGKNRCPAHKKFMSCSKGLRCPVGGKDKACPGIKTMRGGIRYDAFTNGCGLI